MLALLLLYGYFKYFTADYGYPVPNEPKTNTPTKRIVHQMVTLPPHLEGNELFNLAKPTDSSGKEIFADKEIKPLLWEGKPVNYTTLGQRQLEKAHNCDVTSLWDDPNVKPKCTAALFRKYYSKCGYMLDTGKWKRWKYGYPKAKFVPNLCDMPAADTIEDDIIKTIGKWGAKKILILGDSNSHKFYKQMIQTMFNYTKLDYKCSLVKEEAEGKHADASYYTNGTKFKPEEILIKDRTCSTCNSELNKCILPPSSPYYSLLPHEIEMEYLSMTLVTLDAITLRDEKITQQEFLLKYYLKDRYPQLLFIGATFTHDKRKPFDFVQKCLEHFISVVDENVPKSTKVMWFDAAAHNGISYNNCPILFNMRVFDMEYELRGNEKLEMLNHLMFYILKDKLMDEKSNNYAMVDLYALSMRVMKGWAADCVHFVPSWYQTLIGYMFGLLATVEN